MAGQNEVYPRPRGGTKSRGMLRMSATGLSPPTRGNLPGAYPQRRGRRSIPAHAGEPYTASEAANMSAVYPRPRGGTRRAGGAPPRSRGLSPPTRGNPRAADGSPARLGSIPAHAGEPGAGEPPHTQEGVYPRPRGGTAQRQRANRGLGGLSPPTRGNPCPRPARRSTSRSIPAHAGEPPARCGGGGRQRVYPRPRGGT